MLDDPGLGTVRELARDLMASRARTSRVTAGLGGQRLLGPKLAIVNPPLWEIGHVAWFQERWCLRWQPAGALRASRLDGADALYDSSAVPTTRAGTCRCPISRRPAPTRKACSRRCSSGSGASPRTRRCATSCAWRPCTRTCTPRPSTTPATRSATRTRFRTSPGFPAAPEAAPGDAECAGGASSSARGQAAASCSTTRSGRTRCAWRRFRSRVRR